MQKAELVVEYQKDGKTEYAVLFHGYATQRRLYLKRVSHCEKACEGLRYVCVNKNDTKPFHGESHGADVSRVMEVSNTTGLMDPRLKEIKGIYNIALIENRGYF